MDSWVALKIKTNKILRVLQYRNTFHILFQCNPSFFLSVLSSFLTIDQILSQKCKFPQHLGISITFILVCFYPPAFDMKSVNCLLVCDLFPFRRKENFVGRSYSWSVLALRLNHHLGWCYYYIASILQHSIMKLFHNFLYAFSISVHHQSFYVLSHFICFSDSCLFSVSVSARKKNS